MVLIVGETGVAVEGVPVVAADVVVVVRAAAVVVATVARGARTTP